MTTTTTSTSAKTPDLVEILDAPPPAGRVHRYSHHRPSAAHMSPEVRAAIRRLDQLADRLHASRVEIGAYNDASRDQAAAADAQLIVEATTSGAPLEPGKHLAQWQATRDALATEQLALTEAITREETDTMYLIMGQWDDEIADLLRTHCAPAVGKYLKALTALEAAEEEMAQTRRLASWFVRAGTGFTTGNQPDAFHLTADVELRRGTDYTHEIDSGNQVIGVIPTHPHILEALRRRAAALQTMKQGA